MRSSTSSGCGMLDVYGLLHLDFEDPLLRKYGSQSSNMVVLGCDLKVVGMRVPSTRDRGADT